MPLSALKKQQTIVTEHIIMEYIATFATFLFSRTSTPLESYYFHSHSHLIHSQPLATLHIPSFSSLPQQSRCRLLLNHPELIISLVPTPTALLIWMPVIHLNLHAPPQHLYISYHQLTKSG
jgi:hypothetical protein